MNSDLKGEGHDKVEKKVGQPDWYQVVSMLHLFRDSASKEGQVLAVGCPGWCTLACPILVGLTRLQPLQTEIFISKTAGVFRRLCLSLPL